MVLGEVNGVIAPQGSNPSNRLFGNLARHRSSRGKAEPEIRTDEGQRKRVGSVDANSERVKSSHNATGGTLPDLCAYAGYRLSPLTVAALSGAITLPESWSFSGGKGPCPTRSETRRRWSWVLLTALSADSRRTSRLVVSSLERHRTRTCRPVASGRRDLGLPVRREPPFRKPFALRKRCDSGVLECVRLVDLLQDMTMIWPAFAAFRGRHVSTMRLHLLFNSPRTALRWRAAIASG